MVYSGEWNYSFKSLNKKDIDDFLEFPNGLNSIIYMMDGVYLNVIEEKIVVMCLSLEFLNLGRIMFSFIDFLPRKNADVKKIIMIGDLFFALASTTASKTKNLKFYNIFSEKCTRMSKHMHIIDSRIKENPNWEGF